MQNLFSLQNKTIAVIGGAGNLGSIICAYLEDQGATVLSVDIQEPTSDHEKRVQPHFFACDITDEPSVITCLNNIKDEFGVPDGVVISAALDAPPDHDSAVNGPLETSPVEYFKKIIDVNLNGSFIVGKVFGSAMAEEGRGSIILFNSIYGVVAPRQEIYEFRRKNGDEFYKPPAYSVSKSGLTNLKHYLATYWGKSGVRVNEVILGGVFNNQDPEFVKAYSAQVPMGRMANPEEILGAVSLLLSDASSYMTGSSITIDGGYTAW